MRLEGEDEVFTVTWISTLTDSRDEVLWITFPAAAVADLLTDTGDDDVEKGCDKST